MGHKDLRLGQIVQNLVFYNFSLSWLLPRDGFQFIFSLRKRPSCRFMHSQCKNENIPMWGKHRCRITKEIAIHLTGSLLKKIIIINTCNNTDKETQGCH